MRALTAFGKQLIAAVNGGFELALTSDVLLASTTERWCIANSVLSPDELLAADMASAEHGMLRVYKRLIDEGFGLLLDEAMAREAQRSKEWVAVQTPVELESAGGGAGTGAGAGGEVEALRSRGLAAGAELAFGC